MIFAFIIGALCLIVGGLGKFGGIAPEKKDGVLFMATIAIAYCVLLAISIASVYAITAFINYLFL